MNTLVKQLKSKTKIVAALMAVLVGLKTQGVISITPEVWQLLEAAGLFFLRDAIGKAKS